MWGLPGGPPVAPQHLWNVGPALGRGACLVELAVSGRGRPFQVGLALS